MNKLQVLSAFLLLGLSFANAQELPNKQEASLRAPANMKIDGRATEWNNQFRAYNHATEIFYTVANDDENFYLTVHATDPFIIQKIITHSLVFTVNSSLKKDDKQQVSLTFPILQEKDTRGITASLNYRPKNASNDPAVIRKRNDSLVTVMNSDITYLASLIKVKGIPSTNDYLFNKDLGVQAVELFDADKAYTLEIAIPIKYLQLPKDQPAKFSYNVKINGVDKSLLTVEVLETAPDGTKTVLTTNVNPASDRYNSKVKLHIAPKDQGYLTTVYPTDFWGEYTLAQK